MTDVASGFEEYLRAISPRVDFATATVSTVRSLGFHLLEAHAKELEPDLAPFYRPDWDAYKAMEDAGQLIVVVAWYGRVMVGYAVASLSRSPHYDRVICQHGLLYVTPELRSKGVGLALIRDLRHEARRRGADRLVMHAKVGTKLEKLLPHLGFKTEETVFVEDLCRTP